MEEDIIGKKYNYLTVLAYESNNKYGAIRLRCRCDCGNETIVLRSSVLSGHTKSCGCLKNKLQYGLDRRVNKRLYGIWDKMRNRCNNPRNAGYRLYGKRGISVCDEWNRKPDGFYSFFIWSMNNGYAENLTLDRIDVNKGYSPDNCRWTTMKVQARNKTNSRMITYNGKTQCLKDWSEELGIKYSILQNRLNSGWSVDKAFTTPKLK